MDIRAFFSRLPSMSSGKAAAKSGFAYERAVHARCLGLLYNGERVQMAPPAGASKNAIDLPFLNCDGLTMELKTKGAFEGGAKTMKYRDGAFQLPDHPLLREMVLSVTQLPLWDGFVPSCMKGDKSEATWFAEKDSVKDIKEYVQSSAVADYYRAKGTWYIQVEGRGIYHTGEDVKGWGVPKFDPTCKVRIRMKQHTRSPVPQDCQASLNYDRKSLPPSPYDLMTRLPPGFTLAAE